MAAITFDTLKFVRTLEAAGMRTQQAEAVATAVRDSSESADLVTKADLRELKMELKAEISELEQRMLIKLGTMMVVAMAVVAAVVKL